MDSIYYLLAKIGLDTAENEPSKVCRYLHTNPLGSKFRSACVQAKTRRCEDALFSDASAGQAKKRTPKKQIIAESGGHSGRASAIALAETEIAFQNLAK